MFGVLAKKQQLVLDVCFFIVFPKIQNVWFDLLKNPKIAKLLGVVFEKQTIQNCCLNCCFSPKQQTILLYFAPIFAFPQKTNTFALRRGT